MRIRETRKGTRKFIAFKSSTTDCKKFTGGALELNYQGTSCLCQRQQADCNRLIRVPCGNISASCKKQDTVLAGRFPRAYNVNAFQTEGRFSLYGVIRQDHGTITPTVFMGVPCGNLSGLPSPVERSATRMAPPALLAEGRRFSNNPTGKPKMLKLFSHGRSVSTANVNPLINNSTFKATALGQLLFDVATGTEDSFKQGRVLVQALMNVREDACRYRASSPAVSTADDDKAIQALINSVLAIAMAKSEEGLA